MLHRLFKGSLIVAVWAVVALAGLVAWYAYDLPRPESLESASRRPSVTLVSEKGVPIATYGDLFAGPVELAQVPPYLVQAIVATEDRRFFSHRGLDPLGIARAMLANLRAGTIRQGGSTITQQLAKNLFLTPERSLRRKVQESLLAFWLESWFSKEQLLTIYLNRVYLGAGTYGVAAAAHKYFGRAAADINLHEAAVLAGLLKAPSRYAPTHDVAAAKQRAAQVLANMAEAGYLTAAEVTAAEAQPIRILPTARDGTGARYFADWVMEGASSQIGTGAGDLVIVTTLDPDWQRLAEDALRRVLADRRGGAGPQAALIALTPDGAIRAMVGGRDYVESPFNRATQAQRQPGSAFKLFVYLAAMEAGFRPDDTFVDGPIEVAGWRPRNYDGRYRGTITLAEALAQSVNTVAVRLAERVGRRQVVAAARRLGVTAPLHTDPSLALGTSEVSLIELTAAYGALAAGGRMVLPHGIVEIREAGGRVLYRRAGSGGGRVIGADAQVALDAMLSGVVDFGTGRAARLDRPVAGKTGTSQDSRDAWFVGYTAEMVAGVWMGFDDGAPMNDVAGGGAPARLWQVFARAALAGRPPRPLPGPATATSAPDHDARSPSPEFRVND